MNGNHTPYRWFVELVVALSLVAQIAIWMAPAPLLPRMIPELNLSMAQAGLTTSIICLCVVVFSLVGSVITAHLGLKRTFALGLWLLALGAISTQLVRDYASLMAVRIVQGIGYGILLPLIGGMVMEWFSPREKPYMNMINAVLLYLGFIVVYKLTVPLFQLTLSWKFPFLVYGFYTLGLALLWSLLGRERCRASSPASHGLARYRDLRDVLWMKDIWYLSIAYFAGFWSWQVLTTFLPTYYVAMRGMGLREASMAVSILPMAGIFAALLGGLGTTWVGLRKPFLWPTQVIYLMGTFGAVICTGLPMQVSLALIGIGGAGWLTALFTIPMELPGMTPVKVTLATALIRGLGYTNAFLSPIVGGWIAEATGLFAMLFLFCFVGIVPVVATLLVTETGPRARRQLNRPPLNE